MLTPYQADRYSRQVLCEHIGEDVQAGICRGHVAVVGIGAVGSAAVNMLARAGVGTLTLIDHDRVEFNNLQRQTLYGEAEAEAGALKAEASARRLAEINSSIVLRPVTQKLTPENAEELLAGADVILDGADNFEARYIINDVACKYRIPYIYAAVLGGFGVTMSILPGETACLQCLFPEPPAPGTTDTAATRGILASIVNIVASLQVVEALKILGGKRDEVCRGLFQFDCWDRTACAAEVHRLPECPSCVLGEYRFLNPGQ